MPFQRDMKLLTAFKAKVYPNWPSSFRHGQTRNVEYRWRLERTPTV